MSGVGGPNLICICKVVYDFNDQSMHNPVAPMQGQQSINLSWGLSPLISWTVLGVTMRSLCVQFHLVKILN